jgi:hypothetical protein
MICGSGHIQSIYSSAYLDFNIQQKVGPLLMDVSRQCNERYTASLVPITAHILQFTLCELWSGHVDCIYSSAYSDFNIQMKVSPLLLEVSRQCNERYTASLVPITAHILQFTLCELWSWPYTKYLQLRIYKLQYSAAGIIAAIVDITSIQCASYCKLSAKDSAHPPVYAM